MKALVAAAIVAGLATAGSQARADTTTELRIATLAPSGSTWSKKLTKAAADINDKTSGRLTLKWYEGGSQGDEKDYVRKINLGQLDGAAITSIGLSLIDESIRVLELPGMFDSIEEMDDVTKQMWPKFQASFLAKGYYLADPGDVGWYYVLSKDKIESLADLQKAKLWLWGDDKIIGALYKELGVTPVPLGVPEVDAALTSGRINACYGSPLASVALQWNTKVKYRTDLALFYGIGATVLSKKALDALPPADRKIALDRLKKSAPEIRKAVRQDNIDAAKGMDRSGVKVTTVTFAPDFQKAAEKTWKDLVGTVYTQEQLDEVLKLRQQYRDKHKKP